jgi:hypothetical protein
VTSRLARLTGRGTNCYLEVLEPARMLDRVRNRPRIVYTGRGGGEEFGLGLSGRPFVIKEVLDAYRVPGGIVRPTDKSAYKVESFDALITCDGRVWEFSGVGAAENTFQLRAVNAKRLDQLSSEDLERIRAGLPE